MEESFRQEIKQKLEQERDDLRQRLGKFAKEDDKIKDDFHSDFPDIGDKEEDNATEVAEYQDNLSLEDNLEKRLQDVETALSRMDEDQFGFCRKCGQEIMPERLRVNPAASTCVKCNEV